MNRNESLKNSVNEIVKGESFTDGELLAVIGFLNSIKDKDDSVKNYTINQLIKESRQIDMFNKARIIW